MYTSRYRSTGWLAGALRPGRLQQCRRAAANAVVVALAACAARTSEPPTIAARAVGASVTVITLSARGDTISQGSGFVVQPEGVIVTSCHVVRGAARMAVILNDERRFNRARLLECDAAVDVAVLKIPAADLPTLRTTPESPPIGGALVVVSSPLGMAGTVTDGIVSATRILDGRDLIQLSATVSYGSSGGAVLDRQGRVFAMASGGIAHNASLGFATPMRLALPVLERAVGHRGL